MQKEIDIEALKDEYLESTADYYILYTRKSTPEEQYDNHDQVSVVQQKDACLELAKRRGLKLLKEDGKVVEFSEMVSAKNPDRREEFRKMLKFLEYKSERGDKVGILSWAVDRLSRNALEAGELIQMYLDKQIADFQFCTFYFMHNGSGLEYLMMEFARAMGYSLRLKENVTRGMYRKFKHGKEWVVPDKFGYRRYQEETTNNGRKKLISYNFPIPKEPEFTFLRMAFELRMQGKTFTEIAKIINKNGFIEETGKKMSATKLSGAGRNRGYLKDPFYYGLAEIRFKDYKEPVRIDYRGDYLTTNKGGRIEFTPVITEEEFNLCQEINKKAQKSERKTKHENLPCRLILKCGYCGNSISPQLKKGNVYYYCGRTGCKGKRIHTQNKKKITKEGISGKELFEYIEGKLKKEFCLNKRQYTAYLLYLEKQYQLGKMAVGSNLKRVNSQIAYYKRQIDVNKLEMREKIKNTKNDSVLEKIVESHTAEEKRLNEKLESLHEERIGYERKDTGAWVKDFNTFLELSKNLYSIWKTANLLKKTKIAESLFLELVVKDGKIASHSYKEPYATVKTSLKAVHGGPGWI